MARPKDSEDCPHAMIEARADMSELCWRIRCLDCGRRATVENNRGDFRFGVVKEDAIAALHLAPDPCRHDFTPPGMASFDDYAAFARVLQERDARGVCVLCASSNEEGLDHRICAACR